MDRAKLREFGTSLASLLFIVVGLSGVLMFFHLFESYIKEMHEVLGVVFVLAIFAHIVANYRGLKTYFNRWIYKTFAIVVTAISLGFILSADTTPNAKKVAYLKLTNQPIDKTLILFGDYEKVKSDLSMLGVDIADSKTIKDIAINNGISPKELIKKLDSISN